MAEKSDKAKKAAATKAHKQLQQKQADMELMESTHGQLSHGFFKLKDTLLTK